MIVSLLRAAGAAALLLGVLFPAFLHGQIHPLNGQDPVAAGFNQPSAIGQWGWRFKCNANGVLVTQLGTWFPDSATVVHSIQLYDFNSQALLANASPPAGPGWRWETLTTPVPLVNGNDYIIQGFTTTTKFFLNTSPASWMPTGDISWVEGRYHTSTPTPIFPTSALANYGSGVVDIGYVKGPTLTVNAAAGTAQTVFSNAQGPGGNGVEAGSFTIASNGQTPNSEMINIDLTASGTGNDANAISEVRIYRDDPSGASPGSYDPADIAVSGPDVFPADDGTINFTVATSEQAFNLNETRTYFVVVKLAGNADPGQTFNFTVSDITVTTGSKSVGGATMNGLIIDTPLFVFTDNSATQPATVYLTFSGVCQEFTIAYPNGPDDKPMDLTISSLGTANELTDLIGVHLWWDSDTDGAFNAANDTLVNTQTFTQDNGNVTFSLASHPAFQAGQTRRYFVVYELNASAGDLETFKCFIADIGPSSLGGVASGLPSPSSNGTAGLEIRAAILFGVMHGPLAPVTVDSNSVGNGEGELLADVSLDALPGGAWGIDSVIFNAGGTGNHNSAYAELALYEDINMNGAWDGAGTDTLAAPVASGFTANVVSFDLIVTALGAGAERRFFLLGKLNGTAATGQTFGARLTGFVAGIVPSGGTDSGFPTAASTALVIDVAALSVANGPYQPDPLTHAGGAAGELVAANFRLNALNGATTVTGINFTTGGSGDWTSDVDSTSGVRVYRDDDDGVYGATDTLLFQGGGAAVVTATFATPLSLAVGEIADLWVVVGFTATAGQGVSTAPETFNLSIANTTDVSASAPVVFGTPAPTGVTVGAISFSVTNFDPASDSTAGGQAITIAGSGFMAPLSVTIGGALCAGTPVIAGGTQVTGLTVPPGVGANLQIVVRSGTLPAQTLTQTFTYRAPDDNDPPKADESGCVSGHSQQWALLVAALGLLGTVAVLRRRTA